MKAPVSCITIWNGSEIFRDADGERIHLFKLAMEFNLLTTERDSLRTELDAARKQIEQRDALLNDAYDGIMHLALEGSDYNCIPCQKVDAWLETYKTHKNLTSSGLDVPEQAHPVQRATIDMDGPNTDIAEVRVVSKDGRCLYHGSGAGLAELLEKYES